MTLEEDVSQFSFRDENLNIEERVKDLLSRLTIEEKLKLLTSHPKLGFYSTTPIKRLGVPKLGLTDGPLGVAYHSSSRTKCTRFPATIALAATWNRDLSKEFGLALGREVRSIGKHILLAPGINIDRTPLCGRTFEYFGEDPYLTKEMSIPIVKAIQSLRIGACIKHYAANNQERDRRTCSSEIDERTLHEIYLRAFEAVVKEADPWSVMACYNKVNGVYGCENKKLLREILMDKWGFKGFVMSDWGATRNCESAESCVNAGLSLEMPWPLKYKTKILLRASNEKEFSDETLDDLIARYIRVMMLTGAFDSETSYPAGARNTREHHELARRIAEEGMVLLKNNGNILPLDMTSVDSIALLGPNLKKKFGSFLSGGSSAVVPPYEITPLEGMKEKCKGKIQIVSDPSKADITIIFAGLNHSRGMDAETKDRESMELPVKQIQLIKQTAALNPNTIVVLISGSPLEMGGWLEDIPVVLEAWYGGMEAGRAIANVLFGEVTPSGKLPITFPKNLLDSPAHSSGPSRTYPGDEERRVFYEEGIFVGYKWFDKKDIEPLFPFGFGLSYTEFEYRNLEIDQQAISKSDNIIHATVEIENVGKYNGKEIVQLYYTDLDASVQRPPKELASFEKVELNPGETKTADLVLKAHDFAFYDIIGNDWKIEPGEFRLLVGPSSRNMCLESEFEFVG
jgi:beta-glucosidase